MNRPTYIVKTSQRTYTLKDWAEVTHVSAIYFEENPDGEPLEIRQVRNETGSDPESVGE